ncbi:MAG: metal ABC transporter ATP-binding protein [Spirochaetaceae bacterium]|nr:metal ABC transporter ATP-binding protein [Spirochaetaceae bacterium]
MLKLFHSLNYGGQCHLPAIGGLAALRLENVSYRYSSMPEDVLNNVSLTVKPGERIALVGPNGAGKSTLLKLILGMETLSRGTIDVFGHPAARCLHRVAVVPQRSTVDWNFPVTVRQVVMMGRYVHLGWFKHPQTADYDAVDAALDAMEIANLSDRQVGELSGGQQQRVMLARTLAHDADLMLLDEPLNHVDITTQELIFHTLERLTAKGKSVIVSTHDLGVLTVHFTRALFLDKRIIADGPPKEVLTPETIAEAYGFEFHKDYHPWNS